MQKMLFIFVVFTLLVVSLPLFAHSLGRGKHAARKAILLVAFGTSVSEARRAYDRIDEEVKKAFPDMEVRWAYTSKMIRAKLARQGNHIPSPELALARMMDEGYTHVAILSLHVFPGKEFHDLHLNASLYGKMAKGFEQIQVARPLLASYEDIQRAAKALLNMIPSDRNSDDVVLFMGHGNDKHPADAMYAALNYMFHEVSSNVMVASLQGRPNLEDILPKLIEKKVKRVFLIPFMVVAGEHARRDMAGDIPESWKSRLLQNNLDCETILSGVAENPEILGIWIDHLREVVSTL